VFGVSAKGPAIGEYKPLRVIEARNGSQKTKSGYSREDSAMARLSIQSAMRLMARFLKSSPEFI
jgi:hypothetical protein